MSAYIVEMIGWPTTIADTYAEAIRMAMDAAGPDAVYGHDGDCADGGDRTLVWGDLADAEEDDGARAIGTIRRREVAR